MQRPWGLPSHPERGARDPAGPGVWRTRRLAGQTAPEMLPSAAAAASTAVARVTVPALCAAVLARTQGLDQGFASYDEPGA